MAFRNRLKVLCYLSPIEDKQHADREFLNNLLRIIESIDKWYYPTMLARRRALKYYEAVVAFGGVAYWEGKNK